MNLFQRRDFISHAGFPLTWKIECDALTDGDLETLAHIIAVRVSFSFVHGVPRGGLRIARALQQYAGVDSMRPLIVDDVFTTGASMEEARARLGGGDARGVVLFARTAPPPWIWPVFQFGLPPWLG